MPRRARYIIPCAPHHIVQRGNNRQKVFLDTEDFTRYCYWINKYAEIYRVDILAYCLMPNHVHFIAVPLDRVGLSRLFSTAHMRYARHVHYKRHSSGHVWQGRFFSCVMDDAHLYRAIRYVEYNPVRANMVHVPWDYAWSSAKRHVGQAVSHYIKVVNTTVMDQSGWKVYLMENDWDMVEMLRKATAKGRDCKIGDRALFEDRKRGT